MNTDRAKRLEQAIKARKQWVAETVRTIDGRCCDECNNMVIARRFDDVQVSAARAQTRATPGWQPIR